MNATHSFPMIIALSVSAVLSSPAIAQDNQGTGGPILSAVNLAGSAMDYDGIAFAADDGIATGRTGEEGAGGNDGPNGTQTGLVGTPFASVRWGTEVSYSVAAPSGASTLDLYFMEGWWPDAGRRLMDIEIEGQIVREGFDIVAASDGDFDTPQVLRFTGIDPTISGDPNRIELRVIARRDTAVLSAVVLRCEDTAEACAARVAEAEADRAAAAAAAPQIVDQDESLNVVNGGSVEVRLTNLDPNESYWVTLVPEDLPVGRWADYEDASGVTDTTLRFSAPAMAERMEVRLHMSSGNRLLSRRSVVVLTAQEAATVAPEAMESERMRWQGFWRWTGSREAALGGETASVISTDEGVHLLFNLSWARCEAAFEAGARPELMTPIGFTCPFSPDRVITDIALAEGPDGAIRVNMQLNGQPHHFNIPKEIALPVSASIVPDGFPFETADITLEPTLAAQRAVIEARLEGQGLSADWTSTQVADDLYLHYSNEPEDFFRYVGEHYQVFVLGTGDEAKPIGLIRRWMPAADAQPLHETLVNALQSRYGPESFAQIYDRGFGERYLLGFNWAFDRQGNRLSEPCSGPVAYTHALRYLPGQNYGRLGQIPTYASWVFGCGIHLQVTHSVPRPGQPLQAMQAMLIDSSRIEQSDWARYAAQVPWRIESVRAEAAENAAEQHEAESIQPDL